MKGFTPFFMPLISPTTASCSVNDRQGSRKLHHRVGVKIIIMIAKGRTNYQAMVEDRAESLKLLLSIVPDYISDMRNKVEEEAHSVSEEYTEWDEDAQKEIVRIWHPTLDTTIFDDMLCDFYASMMQRVYSYAEICMLELCKDKKVAQEERFAYMDNPENEKISNLTFYYRMVQNENEISLPAIKRIWTSYRDFHDVRNEITHKELSKSTSRELIEKSIEEVHKLLLNTEKTILTNNK